MLTGQQGTNTGVTPGVMGDQCPPLRAQPNQPDQYDADRVKLVRDRWDAQSSILLPYHRQIEEMVRMIAGRHWEVWSEPMRRYVDVTQYMTEQERFWLQRPTFNLLAYWFQLTHARLTESPPAPLFEPATSDRLDQELADCLTPVFRTLWGETQMDDAFVRLAAWLIIAGCVYLESSAEFTEQAQQSYDANGVASGVGVDPSLYSGSTTSDEGYGDYEGYEGAPDIAPDDQGAEHDGCLVPRVRNPLEVRAEWGEDIPWERKRWMTTVTHLDLDVAKALYGPDIEPTPDIDASSNILQRLIFSAGAFDGSTQLTGTLTNTGRGGARQVAVYTMWEKPSAYSPETPDSPGGRLLIVAGQRVLHDSARPYRCKCAGPIRRANFLEIAGRGGLGGTPLESMTSVQKAYNRGWAQILQHRNLSTNPILVCDSSSGISEQVTNLPGSHIEADFAAVPGGRPAYYLEPPTLSADVWRTQSELLALIRMLGSLAGAEGQPQTDDPSGELVSQLRFNSDRSIAVGARSLASCIAGMAEDWTAILPTIWTDEKTLEYAGEDELFRTVTLTPDLWSGTVNVHPDLENARLETPESKEQRALAKFQLGLFGPPGTPEAAAKFAEFARVSKLESLMEPTSTVDTDMVRWVMSGIVKGVPFDPGMLREQFDYGVWTRVLREHMASPEFNDPSRTPPEIQQQFEVLWTLVQHAQVAQQTTVMQRQAPLAAAQAATTGQIARIAQLNGPKEPQPQSGGNQSPPDAQAA